MFFCMENREKIVFMYSISTGKGFKTKDITTQQAMQTYKLPADIMVFVFESYLFCASRIFGVTASGIVKYEYDECFKL